MANDRSQKQPDTVEEGNQTGRGQQDGRTGGKISKGGSMNEDRSEDESEDIRASAGDEERDESSAPGKSGSQGRPNTGDQSEEEDDQSEGTRGAKR